MSFLLVFVRMREFCNRGSRKTVETCLATYACLTVDPAIASSIQAQSHTFVETVSEIISTVILLSSTESFKMGCCRLQTKVCAQNTG